MKKLGLVNSGFVKTCDETKNKIFITLEFLIDPYKLDTCRTSANLAWKALNNFGDSAFNEYWEEQKPPPIKCEKNCQCGPEKYLATFDWDNETVVYYEVNRAKSTFTLCLSLAIILSISIYLT